MNHKDKTEMGRVRGVAELLLRCSEHSSAQVREEGNVALAALLLAASKAAMPPDKIALLVARADAKKRVRLLSAAQVMGGGGDDGGPSGSSACQGEGGSKDQAWHGGRAHSSSSSSFSGPEPMHVMPCEEQAGALNAARASRQRMPTRLASAPAPAPSPARSAKCTTGAAVRGRGRHSSAAAALGTPPGASVQEQMQEQERHASGQPSPPPLRRVQASAEEISDELVRAVEGVGIAPARACDVAARLQDSGWKVRSDALAEIEEHLKSAFAAAAEEEEQHDSEHAEVLGEGLPALVGTLAGCFVWPKADSNVVVLSSVFRVAALSLMQLVPAVDEGVCARDVALASAAPWPSLAMDKLGGDERVKSAASECLICAGQVLTPAPVLAALSSAARSSRSPKVLCALCKVAEGMAAEFAPSHLDAEALLAFAVQVMEASANPPVRKAALHLLVCLRRTMGAHVWDSLAAGGIVEKAALRKVIQEAVVAAGDSDACADNGGGAKRPVLASGVALDDAVGAPVSAPKVVSLAASFAPHVKVLMQEQGPSWKERLAAVEAVSAMLRRARTQAAAPSCPQTAAPSSLSLPPAPYLDLRYPPLAHMCLPWALLGVSGRQAHEMWHTRAPGVGTCGPL